MLAKDRRDRPADLGDAIEVLGRHEASGATLAFAPPTLTPRTPRPKRAWRRAAVGLAVVVLAGGATAWGARALRARARAAGTKPPIAMTGMVWLPTGELTMGRTKAECDEECARLGKDCLRDKLDREQPAHTVRVSPFYVDVYETTNREYADWLQRIRKVVHTDDVTGEPRQIYDGTNALLLIDTDGDNSGIRVDRDADVEVVPGWEAKPVAQITWDGARLYCASLGKRLPTEAEWEYAARGPTGRRFPWGAEEPRCDGVVLGRAAEGPCAAMPHGSEPVTVGDQDWTPEGIHGMAGNVSEWVEDAFVGPYYADCGKCEDPVQRRAEGALVDVRVLRGSGWANWQYAHSSARARYEHDAMSGSLGVRCAVSSPSLPSP
jgi:formylglycine-generating enzyme required for sulfatase activity